MLPSDPVILAGYVNMKLRDEELTLDEFCEKYGISSEELCRRLSVAGFSYSKVSNSFR